ncbi:sigma-E processing peptidase SpoIIGA [Garciella nitratireducens]|uniref:Sporulation sigma-E factor-processing peptidase n=1 Tax=Garciella nitratireducens DSM 15102 TaxID=1121911 RepID=A0A1T4JTK7_9FIRM|nr:sigma-E processing peptidase SpoIIGA [Garciella nitratireducens]SJZ33488.1 stage II sporulation protein GA (sporulation sigma-E factor processing peptidase) [Garciella nitratireducens DSM 15102]
MLYIYGDIVLFENFIINYIIIWLTAHFSKKKTNLFKMLLGSLVGAIYTIFLFLPSMNFLNTLSMKICLSILIIVIVFTPEKVMDFIRPFSIFYLISFIFGGIAFALIYISNEGGLSSNGFFYISNFPVSLFITTLIIGLFIIKISWEYIQKKISKENILATVYLYIDERKIKIKGLFDTANFLRDPVSRLPVIVVEYDFIQAILPEEINNIFKYNQEQNFQVISKTLLNSNWAKRFRMIPYSSIGKENGLLIGFKTDKIIILDKKEKKEIINVIMAIYCHRLSEDGEYSALLNPEILNM